MQCPRDCPFWRGSSGIQHPNLLTSSSYSSEELERARFCFPEVPVNCNSNCGYGGESKGIEARALPVRVPVALWQHLNHRFIYPNTRNLNSGFERFLPSIYVGGRLRTVSEMHPPAFPVTCTGSLPPLWRIQEQATSLSSSTRSREGEFYTAHGSQRESRPPSNGSTSPVNEEQVLWRSRENEKVYTPNASSDVKELTKTRAALLKPTSCEGKTRSTLKSSNHENAWGGPTYTELITEAILSTPEHRMTLSQIYDWITENVEYFRERKNFTSARGWKNAIRHTLSLRKRFMRVARTTGAASWYNSWWMVNEQYMRSRQISKEKVTRIPNVRKNDLTKLQV